MRSSIKMGGHVIWITFVITAQFSAVLGRNSFYEYYYSRYHHKGHSTTEGLSSSTTGISADISDNSSEEKISSSVPGDTSKENLLHSTVDPVTTVHRDTTLLGNGNVFNSDNFDRYDNDVGINVGIIIGCSLFVIATCTCCLFCCIRMFRRHNIVRTGFIISSNLPGTANEAGAQQQAVGQQYQQPVVAQRYPPQHQEERQHLFPPQYQLQPGQQIPPGEPHQQYSPMLHNPPGEPHHQHSSMLQNPPDAPPPYEFPEKF